MGKRIAALDIGGTSIKSGIYSDGKLEKIRETPTMASWGGPSVIERAKQVIRDYEEPFNAVGISTAGQVDSRRGIIIYANENIPDYTGTKVREEFEKEFSIPAAVENDVNSAALGEAVFGSGKNERDFLCITYGTGVGGAIVSGGAIYTGSTYSAGEFGGIVTHPEAIRAGDPFSGCYEKYASTTALVLAASRIDPSITNGRQVFERAGELKIARAIDLWIDEIVHGLVSLTHIFNPSLIVLGGGVMAQEGVITKIREKAYGRMMKSFCGVRFEQASLGNRAGLLGAAWLADQLGGDSVGG